MCLERKGLELAALPKRNDQSDILQQLLARKIDRPFRMHKVAGVFDAGGPILGAFKIKESAFVLQKNFHNPVVT